MPLDQALELLDRASTPLEVKRLIAKALDEKLAIRERAEFAAPGGLYKFVQHFWPVIEPDTTMKESWALPAVCLHLEACADKRIKRLLINISPGAAKSTLCSVMFPLWLWTARNRAGERIITLSYSASLPERDNRKKLLIIQSEAFKRLYGNRFILTKQGEEIIANNKTGYCMAMGVNASLTGNRGSVLIYDDPNSVTEVESEVIRETTARTFREAASNRLNNMEDSVIIVVQQRTHQEDISGVILDNELPYVHLCIPCEYEEGRHCTTSIGWTDPRSKDGECFWPEHLSPENIANLKLELGKHAWAGQYQQSPSPRKGSIILREYWQPWKEKNWPECHYTLASLDPAYTDRDANDPSGFTIWGCFSQEDGTPGVVLMHAFRKWLPICGPYQPKWPGETVHDYKARTEDKWGLVEHVNDACKRFDVDHLIIENKASGISINQTMARLFGRTRYTVGLVDPKNVGKVGRLNRVQPVFVADQVFAPDRTWADMVIDECAICPNGKWDDLADSTSQAIHYLRTHGYLERREDQFTKKREAMQRYKELAPLYPA